MGKMVGKASENYGKIWTKDLEIKKYHTEGLNYYQIAKKIDYNPTSVIKRCEQLGLVFVERDRPENHLQKILLMRQQDLSIREIARNLNFSHPTISSLLKKYNQDTSKKKYSFNEEFFDIIDTEEKAYCLGLMLSDGYVQHGRIALTMTDLDVIEKFKKCFNYQENYRIIPPQKAHHKIKYEVNIYSVKLTKAIKKYGIIPNKSLILSFPDLSLIPENLLHHLVRGIFDGDGHLGFDKTGKQWRIVFAGTKEVLQGIEKVSGISGQFDHIGKETNTNTWHWKIRKLSDIVKFLQWMYKDSTIYMDRKFIKSSKCIQWSKDKNYDCVLLEGDEKEKAIQQIKKYHYTHSIPSGKSYYFKYSNCIIVYSIPANNKLAKYILGYQGNLWELTRLYAPDQHEPNLLTQSISSSVKMLHRIDPNIEALVSYADPNVGHLGGVYKAASWIYTGQSNESRYYTNKDGQVVSRRKFHSGNKCLTKSEIENLGYTELKRPGKHRFIRALCNKAKKSIKIKWKTDLY